MREILFRGKTDKGEWVQGTYYHQTEFYGNKCDCHYIIETCDELEDNMMTFSKVIPETIGQYTGLKDLFDHKIFEGDIVKSIYSLKQVNGFIEREIRSSIEYNVGYAYSEVYGVCQRFRDGSGVALLSLIQGTEVADCEVIGNIHDNPELLKEREG